MTNNWTFYPDANPKAPQMGAGAPYPTSMPGVWRYGEAPNDNMKDFLEAVRRLSSPGDVPQWAMDLINFREGKDVVEAYMNSYHPTKRTRESFRGFAKGWDESKRAFERALREAKKQGDAE